jgi:hypothetical protein
MIAEYRKKTNCGVGLGIVLHVIGELLFTSWNSLALPFLIVGAVLFIWGCWSFAVGKGYHAAWGLLGLLSIIGLIILVLFPDRNK